jgi:hypothetical protein
MRRRRGGDLRTERASRPSEEYLGESDSSWRDHDEETSCRLLLRTAPPVLRRRAGQDQHLPLPRLPATDGQRVRRSGAVSRRCHAARGAGNDVGAACRRRRRGGAAFLSDMRIHGVLANQVAAGPHDGRRGGIRRPGVSRAADFHLGVHAARVGLSAARNRAHRLNGAPPPRRSRWWPGSFRRQRTRFPRYAWRGGSRP